MLFAIGTPGKKVRMYLETLNADLARSQAQPGETCAEATDRIIDGLILADGSVVAGGAE